MRNRDRNVIPDGVAAPAATAPPRGDARPRTPLPSRASRAHASRAREYTPPPQVVLEKRTRRGARLTEKTARSDPMRAYDHACEYVKGVLRQAARRNMPAARGWCWVLVHLLDAAGNAIERGDLPHPWFRDHAHWRLNPAGWAPLAPVVKQFAAIHRQEASDV